MIPKWLRKRTYKKVLKLVVEDKEIHLCNTVPDFFPFLPLNYYPELWNRRDHLGIHCIEPFHNQEDRINYLKDAILIVEGKL